MPDNWFYYIVLAVLLVIMIILGFFIGYNYQGDQDQLENELKESKEKLKTLEDKMKIDSASYEEMSNELDDIKSKYARYIERLGAQGTDVEKSMKEYEDEQARGLRRVEIIQKLVKWIQDTSSVPSPKAEDLNLTKEGGIEEYEKIINE